MDSMVFKMKRTFNAVEPNLSPDDKDDASCFSSAIKNPIQRPSHSAKTPLQDQANFLRSFSGAEDGEYEKSDPELSKRKKLGAPVVNEEFSPTSAVVVEKDFKPKVEEKLSFFEIQRRKNLVENSKFLDEMGLNSAASVLAPPKPVRKYHTKKDNLVLLPERSSGRLVNARLKDDYVEPNYKPPRNLKEFYTTESKSKKSNILEKDALLQRMQKLTMEASVECRIRQQTDIKFHPSQSQILVVVSDILGKICCWEVSKKNKWRMFKLHDAVASHIEFSPSNGNKLYTCSHDGSIKCVDLITKQPTVVCRYRDTERPAKFHWFDFLNKRTLCAGTELGRVFIVDSRCHGKKSSTKQSSFSSNPVAQFSNEAAPIICVSSHPTKSYVLASSSVSAKIWDVRATKTHVEELCHGKGLRTAFFSPLSGDKILCTWPTQKIKVFDSSVLSAGAVEETSNVDFSKRVFSTSIYTAYAIWHPLCEDIFVIRCTKNANEMAVYGTDAYLPAMKLQATSNLSSRYAIHPQLDMVVTMEDTKRAILWR